MAANLKTILVIDDDKDFQFMIATVLRASGFKVKALMQGDINAAAALADGCDIVILDVDLPGATGPEIGQALKSIDNTMVIPIILLTGHSDCDVLLIESQANALIEKPFSVSQLMTKIEELLRDRDSAKSQEAIYSPSTN